MRSFEAVRESAAYRAYHSVTARAYADVVASLCSSEDARHVFDGFVIDACSIDVAEVES